MSSAAFRIAALPHSSAGNAFQATLAIGVLAAMIRPATPSGWRTTIAANTPIANVAWKAFPALLCGNAAILKAAEDTPLSAWAFGVMAREAGVPDGVYTTVHGFGEEAGAPLVEHPDVAVVSFTGSCEVGR